MIADIDDCVSEWNEVHVKPLLLEYIHWILPILPEANDKLTVEPWQTVNAGVKVPTTVRFVANEVTVWTWTVTGLEVEDEQASLETIALNALLEFKFVDKVLEEFPQRGV